MSIYSNENIRKITKLTPRELLQLVQNCKNNGVYSRSFVALKTNHFQQNCSLLPLQQIILYGNKLGDLKRALYDVVPQV